MSHFVRRNNRMQVRRERGLRDGLFACGGFSPRRERCTCRPDRASSP